MKIFNSNLAFILDLLNISGRRLSEETGIDKYQIARWKSGSRMMYRNHESTKKIVGFLVDEDFSSANPIVKTVLKIVYPITLGTESEIKNHLRIWLAESLDDVEQNRQMQLSIYLHILKNEIDNSDSKLRSSKILPPGNHISKDGPKETQKLVYAFVNYINSIDRPVDIMFVCSQGLDALTKEYEFAESILNLLMSMFSKGHTLTVVLRTDFKESDVSAISGKWLVAHLMGHIKSWYYDDFRLIETDKILLSVKDKMAIKIHGDGWKYEKYMNTCDIDKIISTSEKYIKRSEQRFVYDFFKRPDDCLNNIHDINKNTCYFFQKLPFFSIGGIDFLKNLNINKDEMQYISKQFEPLIIPPEAFDHSTNVFHVFCIDTLFEMLNKDRSLHHMYTEMLGHRIYIKTQTFVDQLLSIKENLKKKKSYRVAFVQKDFFEDLCMEIGVWGDLAAIGYLNAEKSTATNDHSNSAVLQGFCDTIWNNLPTAQKSRKTANRILDKLISRAKKRGYEVIMR